MDRDLSDPLNDDLGTIRWFGPSWGAPVCDPRTNIPTPVDTFCEGCSQRITQGENGVTYPYWDGYGPDGSDGSGGIVAYHRECNLRSVLGCSANLRGEGHDHEREYRQDALRVEAWLADHSLQ